MEQAASMYSHGGRTHELGCQIGLTILQSISDDFSKIVAKLRDCCAL